MTNKNYYLNKNFSYFILLIIIFLPKIDLMALPGLWQGIRIEDCLILMFSFYIFFSKKIFFPKNYIKKFQYKAYYYFFIYLFFSNLVGIVSGIEIKYIMLIRLIEYIIYLILIDRLNIARNDFLKLMKIFLIINVIIVILQANDLIGSLSSLGYKPPSHEINQRAVGLLGGSWELSIFSTICYFFIFENEKNKINVIFYFFITAFLVVMAESKTQTMAFVLLNFILLYRSKNFLFLVILLVMVLSSIIFIDANIFTKLRNINITYILDLTYQTFVEDNLPLKDEVDEPYLYLSYWYRLNFWKSLYDEYLTNIATIIFGTGFSSIYTESFIIRILFSSGIFGTLYLFYLLRNTRLIYLLFFGFAGLTLDLFISLKIFLITLLIVKNNFDEKNTISN